MRKNILRYVGCALALATCILGNSKYLSAQSLEEEDTVAIDCILSEGRILNESLLQDNMESLTESGINFVINTISDAQTADEARICAATAVEFFQQSSENTSLEIFYNIDKMNEDLEDVVVAFCTTIDDYGYPTGYCTSQENKVDSGEYVLQNKNVYMYPHDENEQKLDCYVYTENEKSSSAKLDENEMIRDTIGTAEASEFETVQNSDETKGSVEEATADGWMLFEGKWYYIENGMTVKGERRIDGLWYYFDESTGERLSGFRQIGSRMLYYDPDTGVMSTGEKKIDGAWYCFSTVNGNMETGWQKKGTRALYYLPDGRMALGKIQIAGTPYFFSFENGNMVKGWYISDKTRVYCDPWSGVLQVGEQKIDGKWYYFDEESGKSVSGFKQVGNRMVYYDPDTGVMSTGEKKIDGAWYSFSVLNGNVETGWQKKGARMLYYLPDGQMATGRVQIDDAWYCFSFSNGDMVTGWYYVGDKKMYFKPDTGKAAIGENKIGDGWYYFNEKTGENVVGYMQIGGRTVYYDPETGIMVTGEKKIDGFWHLFSEWNGNMERGWHEFKARTVYYDPETGAMLTGKHIIEGNTYCFSSVNGNLYRNIWLEGLYYDEEGVLSANENYRGKKIAILGDSISTFDGWIPEGNISRYPQNTYKDGVKKVEQTWWKSLIDDFDMELGANVSQSRMTVSGWYNLFSRLGVNMIEQLGENGTPDVIFMFMGTNDLIRNIDIGSYEEAEIGNMDKVIDSYLTVVTLIQKYYPDAELILISPYYCSTHYFNENTDHLLTEISKLCQDKKLQMVDLTKSGIQNGDLPDSLHPGIEGMKKIKRCIAKQLMQNEK